MLELTCDRLVSRRKGVKDSHTLNTIETGSIAHMAHKGASLYRACIQFSEYLGGIFFIYLIISKFISLNKLPIKQYKNRMIE